METPFLVVSTRTGRFIYNLLQSQKSGFPEAGGHPVQDTEVQAN